MVGALAVSTLLIVLFLSLGQYARKETVTGYLAPSAGIVKVFAPRPGSTIRAVHVEEGQQVEGDRREHLHIVMHLPPRLRAELADHVAASFLAARASSASASASTPATRRQAGGTTVCATA